MRDITRQVFGIPKGWNRYRIETDIDDIDSR